MNEITWVCFILKNEWNSKQNSIKSVKKNNQIQIVIKLNV